LDHDPVAEALRVYIDTAGIAEDGNGFLFHNSKGHHGVELSQQPMTQPDAWRMIRKRAAAVGIFAPIGNHSFRATGIIRLAGSPTRRTNGFDLATWVACMASRVARQTRPY
jgi:integrase